MEAPEPPRRPALEVADILRAHGAAYRARHPLSPQQAAVTRHLTQCRTAALGGHIDGCERCGFVRISYNSCRDRHCPKCQATQRQQWIEARLERVLPVAHFHVVFTLPQELNPLVLRNQAVLYGLLFQAAAQTLLTLARDRRRLGAQVGFSAILHTWGQNLLFHPHLHCIVTAGGLSRDGSRWVPAQEGYLLPVKVLGRLFRGKFLAGLQELYQSNRLALRGSTADLADPKAFGALRDRLYRTDWIVYAKPPFGGLPKVFQYLGRYSHRVAISNSRLLSMEDGKVALRYKDYRDGQRWKVMILSAEEFIRRFLLHVLPKRFVRIRHYGLMAGRNVPTKLHQARSLLTPAAPERESSPAPESELPPAPESQSPPASQLPNWRQRVLAWTGQDPLRCPSCQGPLIRRALCDRLRQRVTMATVCDRPWPPATIASVAAADARGWDSS
jgi:hypothetical protein